MASNKKFKGNKQKTGIKMQDMVKSVDEIDYPVFCFKHLTTNSAYNFDCFGQEFKRQLAAHTALVKKIIDLQNQSWKEILSWSKQRGFETMDCSAFNFSGHNTENHVSKDTKYLVFRFKSGSDSYRIIGFKTDRCKYTLHVVGFDFKFNAYNHGS